MLSPSTAAGTPASRATFAAAASAMPGAVIIRVSMPARRGSPGLIVSPRPLSSASIAAGGTSIA
jgi:hypothetical protein